MSKTVTTTSKGKPNTSSGVIVSKALKNIKGNSKKQTQSILNDGADRQELIATAAYYIAEKRGFTFGHEIQNWLEAEVEIDNLLQNSK